MSKKRHRFQLELSESATEALDRLKSQLGLKTPGEVLRNALRVYQYLVAEQTKGWRIELKKGDDRKEVVLFMNEEAL